MGDRGRGGPPAELSPALVMPPADDHSLQAEFRRDVLDLLREVGGLPPGGGDGGGGGGDGGMRSCGAGPEPHQGREGTFNIRGTTLYRLARTARALDRAVPPGGPGGLARALVLLEVGRAGAAFPGQVARSLGVPRSTLSGLLVRAERAGEIRRRRHPQDGRRSLLELTPAGRRVAAEAASSWWGVEARLLRRLTPAEVDELRRLLGKAAGALAGGGRVP